jgi:hypothetical protein
MAWFIFIPSETGDRNEPMVARSGCIVDAKDDIHVMHLDDFASPNEYTANIALVEAINKIRLEPLQPDRGFTFEYKRNLLKRLKDPDIRYVQSHPRRPGPRRFVRFELKWDGVDYSSTSY